MQIRQEAVKQILDYSILIDIIKNISDDVLRAYAVKVLTERSSKSWNESNDQQLLFYIAIHTQDSDIRQTVAKKITDKEFLNNLGNLKDAVTGLPFLLDDDLIRMKMQGSKKGVGCPFYKGGLCVPPIGGIKAIVPCSLQEGRYISNCFVYPIHLSKKQRGY